MRVFVAALIALLLAVPAISASAEEPEITDAAGDHALVGGAPDEGGLVESVDLVQAWVEPSGDESLAFLVQSVQQIRGGQVNGNPTTQYEYTFHFTSAGASYSASAVVVGPAPPTLTPGGVASEAYILPGKDSVLVLVVPLAAIGEPGPGAAISEMFVQSRVFASAATLGTDRAPDAGFGTDYTMPAPVEASAVAYENLTGFPFSNEVTEPVTGSYQYNWTGAAGLHFVADVLQGNLSLNVTVNGQGVLLADAGDSLNETLAEHVCIDQNITPTTCHYAFTYTLDEFVGSYGIDLLPQTPAQNGTAAPGEGAPAGNGTEAPSLDESAGKESPGLALPLLVTAIIVIARRR